MTDDLRQFLLSIVEYDRLEMIRALESKGDQLEARKKAARARAGRSARGIDRDFVKLREANAANDEADVGRVLFFLRHRSVTDGSTKELISLCERLAGVLTKKGQW